MTEREKQEYELALRIGNRRFRFSLPTQEYQERKMHCLPEKSNHEHKKKGVAECQREIKTSQKTT